MAPLSRIAAQLLFLSYMMEVLNSQATADEVIQISSNIPQFQFECVLN
jgi:hypothetical protein